MKKVLVFRRELLPYSETFVRQQVLACRRWHAILAGLLNVKGLPLDGIDTCILKLENRGLVERVTWRLLSYFGKYPPGVLQRLQALEADLVHIHFGWDAVLFYPLLRLLRRPIVVTLHGYDINVSRATWEQSPDPVARRYPRKLLALAQQPDVHFIAVSEAIKQVAISYGIPAAKIDVKYIGVDTSQFRPSTPVSQRKLRILYTGRMVEKKGPNYLIEAFARVKAQISEAELVMIGDGPLLEHCRALAQRLNIPVTFTGSLPGEKIKDYLDTARIFCLPSLTAANGDAEGFGIVLLEAQACGVPVVTSARGGATEGLINGTTGLAFPEKDVDTLTACLLDLLKNEERLSAMSIAAPRFIAEKFDLHQCTAELEDYYDRLVA